MKWRRVWLVLAKEIREALRDRRTLFVTIVLPVLLYPALMIGLGTATARQQGKLREATQRLAFEGPVPALLRENLAETKGLKIEEPESADTALRSGRIHLLVRAADDFPDAIEAGETGLLELVYDSASESSTEARRKAAGVVAAWEKTILAARLEERDIAPEFIDPVKVPKGSESDVASATKRGAHIFGRMLSMLLVIMVVTGAFTPAVDAVSGEKERGTMETLLVSPATRTELVVGKFLSVFAIAMATALGNLVAMALTFGHFAQSLGVKSNVDFTLNAGTAGIILVILVPLAALFTSLAIALSTLARSSKEAQTYLTPLMLVAMPMAMVSMVPNVKLTMGMATVPITGAVLLFRDLMLAQGEPALFSRVAEMIPVVLGSTALAAGLSLRWSVWMFDREEVLFRDPGRPFSWRDLRPVKREGAVPGPGAAVFLPAAALAATYFLGQAFLTKDNVASPWAILLQQGTLLAAVIAGIALARLDWRKTLGTRFSGALTTLAGAVLGVGSFLATPWLIRLSGIEAAEGGSGEIFMALIRDLNPVMLFCLLGLAPALAEEAIFRGWSLRGFRKEMSGGAAVLLSAALFGAFHLEPERIAFTGALGCALGYLALRTGSLWPGVIAHAFHNGLSVLVVQHVLTLPEGSEEALPYRVMDGGSAAWGAVGCLLIAAALATTWFATRPAPDSLPSPDDAG
ncbi:MAG: ABC transporter permease subunit/CPBP intramembrane protease [Planctomycetota bacterium]|jgi:sodium transport system permease protein